MSAARVALWLHHMTTGTAVQASPWKILRLGYHKKLAGCRWTRCPRNLDLSHVAQDTARSRFWGLLTQSTPNLALFSHFWAISWTCCGIKGRQRALSHGAIKAHLGCCQRFPPCVPFDWVLGQKKLFWGTKCAVVGEHLPTCRPHHVTPPPSFWLKNWIWQGHHLGNRMATAE